MKFVMLRMLMVLEILVVLGMLEILVVLGMLVVLMVGMIGGFLSGLYALVVPQTDQFPFMFLLCWSAIVSAMY